ncbi:hypothetical protein JCGZ_26977 [Jatropha curcas]|uniref:Pentacotripeptide-repeat region of PRORP domain-containing protein n=1 Tax=Jatropha curcas TaxID=180498 RepID=A0A067LCX9_JATCU|nr:pentatricopeptide repeat-containing protein At1g80880, mitochondrial isoform X2 [Jatropha curcas]KDP41959.1 hypothetical protein JCGZ_26977 [Jatropha curcas]
MLLITIARRLQRSYPIHVLPLFQSIASPSSPSRLPLKSFFLAAFHRTVSIPDSNSLRFSTSQYFPTQNFKEPFDLIQQRIHVNEALEPSLLDSLKRAAHSPTEAEAVAFVDESGITANQNLVYSLIWNLREEWRQAYLAYKWGQKWGCVDEKCCELMVWVLGSHKKFNIAWILIRDLYRSLMNPRQAMLVMIDRYAAANCPGKAIEAFDVMEKFRLAPDEEAFYTLLNALCKHGNIEEAEEFMLINKKLFPLGTEGFNIILNGWCNICVDVLEAKRVWREMSKCCITPDSTSYTHMITCFSKVGNLFDSLRLYDEMKKRGFVPGIVVYNCLIYVLTHENCFEAALKVVEKMKEHGLQPDSTTFNSIIHSLCERQRLAEARNILAMMVEENICPTMETYHAVLQGTGFEETLEILDQMIISGLAPTKDTFLLILVKFFKLEQPDNALKIWVEMKQYEVTPNATHYRVLVEGLARYGLLTKAQEYYADMKSNGFSDDPKLQKILKPTKAQKCKGKKWVRQVRRDQDVYAGFERITKDWKIKLQRYLQHQLAYSQPSAC